MEEVTPPRARRDSAPLRVLRENVKAVLAVVATIASAAVFVWRMSGDYQSVKGRVDALEDRVQLLEQLLVRKGTQP